MIKLQLRGGGGGVKLTEDLTVEDPETHDKPEEGHLMENRKITPVKK